MATTQTMHRIGTPLHVTITEDRCLHALTGRAPESKLCVHNHECGKCPYDQMLDDTDLGTDGRVCRREKVVRAA